MSASVASTAASTVSSTFTQDDGTAKIKKILVQNVSTFTTEQDLRSLFQPYGRIAYIRLPVNHKGERRHIALVQFVRPDDAARAMAALQSVRLDYMILQLEWAKRPKTKGNSQNRNTTKAKHVLPTTSVVSPSTSAQMIGRPKGDWQHQPVSNYKQKS